MILKNSQLTSAKKTILIISPSTSLNKKFDKQKNVNRQNRGGLEKVGKNKEGKILLKFHRQKLRTKKRGNVFLVLN